jgi:hypothetical protein
MLAVRPSQQSGYVTQKPNAPVIALSSRKLSLVRRGRIGWRTCSRSRESSTR